MFGKAKTRHRGSSGAETFRPSHRPAARAAAVLLSLSVAFTMMPTPVFAVTQERAAETGLCEHHPEHDGECGYQEGEPGHPCGHNRHTVDCYTDVLICGYIEDEDMTASDSDAHHKHTQDCYELDCPHERGEHGADGSEADGEGGLGNEENCGYIEAVEGTPCGYVCGQCDNPDKIGGNGNSNGGNNLPVPEGTGPELMQPDGKEEMTVTAFDRLDEAVQNQTVKAGTTLEELALPKTLSATAQAAGEEPEPVVIDGVAWEPDVLYEGAAGSYVFTASAAGYLPAQGVDWPVIIVTVEEGMPTLDEIDALCDAIDNLPTVEELYENAPGDADPEFDGWVTEISGKLAEVPTLWEQFSALSEDAAAMERITGARAEKLAALNNLVVRLGEMVTLEGITSVDALNQEIISSAGTAKNPTVITIDGAGITVNQSIIIDNKHIKLTGGTLTRAESYTGNLIEVKKGGSLTLEDITLDGNKDKARGGCLINLNKAALVLEDGATLTNNQGSAINIGYHFSGSSSITMNGGVISNNVSEDGGAIKDSDANTVITINGGRITGNEVNGTDTDSTYGGAIFSSGNLIIEGGTITGNSTAKGRGGGIFKTGGNDRKFIVTGGTISGNTAREGDYIGGNGHNVYVNQCAFTMGGEANIPDGLYLKLGGNYSTFTIASALQNPVEIEGIYDYPQVGILVASGAAGDSAYTITDGDVEKFSYKGNAFSFALENNQIKLADLADVRPAWADSGDGASAETAYVISSYANLEKFAANVSGVDPYANAANAFEDTYIRLSDAFPESGGSLTATIGQKDGKEFKGHFDGNGRTVTVNLSGSGYQGLFGAIGTGGSVTKVAVDGTIENTAIGGVTGGVAGDNAGTVQNCVNNAVITSNGSKGTGGVTGINRGTVQSCVNNAKISGGSIVGGLAGNNTGGSIINCINTAKVTGNDTVGGVAGYSEGTGATVEYCYNIGDISATGSVGGCGGVMSNNTSGKVSDCVSLGMTAAIKNAPTDRIGRVVNHNSGGTLSGNKARGDMKVSNQSGPIQITSAPDGPHGETVAVDNTLALSAVFSGWDTNIWTIPDGNLTYGCELPTLTAMAGEAAPTLPGEASMTDAEILAAVKSAIENETYTIPQADAADEEALKAALAAKLNALDIMEGKGIDCEISSPLESFTPAAAGTKDNPTGIDGSFTFTVWLTKGSESVTTNSKSGTITATAYAGPVPTADVAERIVYANGIPLLLVKGSDEEGLVHTVIYIDKGTIGQFDDGTDVIFDPDGDGSMDRTIAGNNLSSWDIYGGSQDTLTDGDTKITMIGGEVSSIYGGGMGGEVSGNTNVTMVGGEVTSIHGGGARGSSKVSGNTSVTMTGGKVQSIYGGGYSGEVSGSAGVTITGGQVYNIYGGGFDGAVGSGTSVEISGDAIIKQYVRGGCARGKVIGNTWVTISGNALVDGEITGAGEESTSSVIGNTNIKIIGGKAGHYVWGGSSKGSETVTGEKNITIGGKVEIGNQIDLGIPVGYGSNGNHVENFAIDANLIGENGCVTVRLQNNVPEGGVIATGAVKSDVAKLKLVGAPGDPMPYVLYFDESDNTIRIKAIPVPEVYQKDIYANGLPLLLVAATPNANNTNENYTVIYHDQDGDGVLDDGEPIVHFNVTGVDNDTTEGNDLTKFTIYGGSRRTDYTGDTSITMLGGQVSEIYGGGNDINTGGKVTGDTSVIVKGGRAVGVYGGGRLSNGTNVDGNTSVVIDGGTVTAGVCGGGNGNGVITGDSTLTINGGTVLSGGPTSMVCGGGNGEVKGTASVNISGGTVNALVFGGGQYSGAAASSQVNVTGGKVTGALYGGGFQMDTTGEASVSMTGGELVKVSGDSYYNGCIYGGNFSSAAGSQTVTLGGSAQADGGVVFKGSGAPNGVSLVAIEPGLTGTKPISFILPSGFNASEKPVIATGAVTSDLAKIKLAGSGAKGLEAYLDGTDIKVHQPYTVSVSVKEQGPYYKNDEIFLIADVRDSKTQAEMTTGTVRFYKEGTPLGDPVSYSPTSGFGKQKGFALSVICGTSSFIPELTAGSDNIIKAIYTSASKTEVASQPITVSVSDKMNGNSYISSLTVANLTGDGDHYVAPVQFGVSNNGGEKGIKASEFVITGTKDSRPFTDFQIDASDNTASVKVREPGTYVFTAKLPESGSYAGMKVSDPVVVLAPYTVTYTLEHLTADNQPAQVNYGKKLSATLTAERGYKLPATVTVSMGGSPLAPDPENGYTYDSTTGVIEIAHATGDIAITANGVAKSADASLLALTYTVEGGSAAAVPGFEADTTTYDVVLPYGTAQDVAIALMGTRSDSSASITENNGATLVNGSGTATMKVTAEDGTTRTYTVNFTIAADTRSDARQITAFAIPGQVGETAIDQNQHTITVTVPHGTDVTRLIPAITVSDKASVNPPSGAAQNFTNSVTYTVTAENGTSQAYSVSVVVQKIEIQTISSAAITGITAPAAGQSPDTEAVTADDAGYTAGTVIWNPADVSFRYSTSYTASVILTAAKGYRFAETVNATINGASATVTRISDTSITVSYQFPKTAAQSSGGSGSSGGGGSSGAGSTGTGTSSVPTTTTSTAAGEDGSTTTITQATAKDNSGNTTTVKAEVIKDAAGNITASTATVTTDNVTTQTGQGSTAVTVRPDAAAINSAVGAAGATADNPMDVVVTVPQDTIHRELEKTEVTAVLIGVVLPGSVEDNPAVRTVGVTIEREIVEAARQSGKRLEVTVREESGYVEAVWSLDGQAMKSAQGQATDLNLGIHTAPVQSTDSIAIPVKPRVMAGGYENGLVIAISADGTLLSPAKLTVPATNQTGITAGSTAVLYRFDQATGTLSPVPGGVYTVDLNGNVTIDIPAGSRTGAKETFVLLPAAVPAAIPGTVPGTAAAGANTGSVYTIQAGDTLNQISRQYGCRVEDLLALNPGVDIYNLQVGSNLNVPVSLVCQAWH